MLEHTLGFREENQEFDDVPELPRKGSCDPEQSEHRPKTMDYELPFPCCIARKVGRKESNSEPKAIEAMNREWAKLETTKRPDPKDRGIGCWDISKVREAASVRDEARRAGAKVQFWADSGIVYGKRGASCRKGTNSANIKGVPGRQRP